MMAFEQIPGKPVSDEKIHRLAALATEPPARNRGPADYRKRFLRDA
jgi:hypothetical protein